MIRDFSNQDLLNDLAEVLTDLHDAAAWKTKSDQPRIKTRQRARAPGNPGAAAILMDLERELERVLRRRRNNLERLKAEAVELDAERGRLLKEGLPKA